MLSFSALGAIFGFLAVGLGAFGAHGLKNSLPADLMDIYQTGVLYHLVHAPVLVMLGMGYSAQSGTWLYLAGVAFCLGILIFSGSLYVLAITGMRWLGAITPLGGLALLIGWAFLATAAMRGELS